MVKKDQRFKRADVLYEASLDGNGRPRYQFTRRNWRHGLVHQLDHSRGGPTLVARHLPDHVTPLGPSPLVDLALFLKYSLFPSVFECLSFVV